MALASAACHGGSGDDDDDDDVAPLAAVQFPPSDCLTDAAQVDLAIAVEDETGVASVRAAGIAALRSPDGLWKVSVPLSPGNNAIVVDVRDTLGNEDPFAATLFVRRESGLWSEPSALAFDALAGQVLVADSAQRGLFAVDPLTRTRRLVSGLNAGSGAPFTSPRDVAFVATLNAAAVTDGASDIVWLVDLTTGSRRDVAGPNVGLGPRPIDLHGIAVDSQRNRLLVLDDARSELMAVDLVTFNRATVSSDAVGIGPSLAGPRRVAIDLARDRALVTSVASQALMAVDLTTGDRSIVSGAATGFGPEFSVPFDVVVDASQDRALVLDTGAQAVFAVELATGDREVLSSETVGLGPDMLAPAGVTMRPFGLPLVIDNRLDALFELGASGDRVILSKFTVGTGPTLMHPMAMAGQSTSPEDLVVADSTALFSVSLADGARALVSGPDVGDGPPFVELVDVIAGNEPSASSQSLACVFALDAGVPGIVGVDRTSGARSLVSGGAIGSGPAFTRPRAMAAEPAAVGACPTSALVVDQDLAGPAVLRVDLVTGARAVLSDADHGTGPALVDPVTIEIDAASGTAFVADAGARAVLAIEPASGDRSIAFAFNSQVGQPIALALDLAHARLVLLTFDAPALFSLDLRRGISTQLSGPDRGLGPLSWTPAGLVLASSATVGAVAPKTIAYVLDSACAAVLAVDLETGARIICSK